MKKYLIIIAAILLTVSAQAQTEILSDNYPTYPYKTKTFGPNRKHCIYFFSNYGLNIPTQNNFDINVIRSGQLNLGYGYKRKFTSFADLALEVSYNNNFHHLNKESREKFDTITEWKTIRTFQNGIQGNAFLRIYLTKKRGNYIGTFVDLGFFTTYHIKSGYHKYLKNKDIMIKQREYPKEIFTELNYGPSVSIGRNYFSVFAQYNLNSIYTDKVEKNPIPQLVAGVKLSIYSRD